MGLYFGEQKIQALLNNCQHPSMEVAYAEKFNSGNTNTYSATASITLPSVPRWYKFYYATDSTISTSSSGTVPISGRYTYTKYLLNNMQESIPVITNGGKTFSKSISKKNPSSSYYGIVFVYIVLIYIL